MGKDWDALAAKVKGAAPLPLPLLRLVTGLALYLLLIAAQFEGQVGEVRGHVGARSGEVKGGSRVLPACVWLALWL